MTFEGKVRLVVFCAFGACTHQTSQDHHATSHAGITFEGKVQLVAFCVFEACVGIFWPSMMKLRSQYLPEESRSTIINFFRIPLNMFVCIMLYNVSPSCNFCNACLRIATQNLCNIGHNFDWAKLGNICCGTFRHYVVFALSFAADLLCTSSAHVSALTLATIKAHDIPALMAFPTPQQTPSCPNIACGAMELQLSAAVNATRHTTGVYTVPLHFAQLQFCSCRSWFYDTQQHMCPIV